MWNLLQYIFAVQHPFTLEQIPVMGIKLSIFLMIFSLQLMLIGKLLQFGFVKPKSE